MKGWGIAIVVLFLISCKSRKNALSEISLSDREQLFSFLYVEGVSARLKNDFQASLEKMEQCRKLLPKQPAPYYETALSLHLMGRTSDAVPYSEKAYAMGPQNIWYGLFYADLLSATGQIQMSAKVKEKIFKDFPNDFEVCLRLAEDYKKLGMSERALEWLNRAEDILGISEEITLEKTSLLQEKKNFELIEKEYIKLIRSDSTEPRYWNYLAELYLNHNRHDKAFWIYDHIFKIQPDYPPALITIAGYHIDKMNFQDGMEYVMKVIITPEADMATKSKVLSALELSYLENKSNGVLEQGLVTAIQSLYKHFPNHFESNYWMSRYYSIYNSRPDSAHFFLKSCLSYDKSRPDIFKSVLEYYIDTKQWDSCLHYSKLATELYPNEPFFYFSKGMALYYKSDYDKCITEFKFALEIPAISKKDVISCLFYLAKAYDKLKKYSESDQAHENILKMNPDYAPALNNYAWMLLERKTHFEKAEKMAKKAYDLYPDSPQYADTYGTVLMFTKKYAEAYEKFKLAHSLLPEKPLYLEHMGDALFLLGRKKEAVEMWNAAIQKGGDKVVLTKKINSGITNEYTP
ncbi:MAG: hypothetical protein N3F09_04735 [Bacteroidia bacterium]|nr:hypothetical protein [Bacteroidia bacterium]